MINEERSGSDMARVFVPLAGSLKATGDPWQPYRLLDPCGRAVEPVAEYLRDLQAADRAEATLRSYGMDLLRWFRFLWAIELHWDRATRREAADFCRRMRLVNKPGTDAGDTNSSLNGIGSSAPGVPNPVTGKPSPTRMYAGTTVAHCETVLRHFYDFHLDTGRGPLVNPFPLARGRRGRRRNAHHNPMEPYRNERSGLFRPRLVVRAPRRIPDDKFNDLFAQLPSLRDRALVAFWISTGARASELLGARQGDVDPGQQLITVIRKGTRALQPLPASPDAFVWLRLYQAQVDDLVLSGADEPLWWTLRRPLRPLTYHAAHRMFTRVNATLGANWTLHDLRHSAAYRMANDPDMPITDVQWVLGHAHLSTTQIYTSPSLQDAISSVLSHHSRQADPANSPPVTDLGGKLSYRRESLDILFGRESP